MTPPWRIANGRVLTGDGIRETDLTIEGERIAAVGGSAGAAAIDARGALVLPGIVDLHGDAFERQLMPRPGVTFGVDLALLDSDRQLVANGITTAFHAITCSWEPGLRSLGHARELVAAIGRLAPQLACDTRVHLRHEVFNLDAIEDLLGWIARGEVHLLALNDHTPAMAKHVGEANRLDRIAERCGMGREAFGTLLRGVFARAGEVPAAVARVAAAAVAAGIPVASHDDETPDMRRARHALGARLCEFPFTRETAATAKELGDVVVMGAPNVVRGGSHIKLVAAADMVAAGLCQVLTSDYFYPALAQAPFRLVRDGVADLAAAWPLVSTNPARAVGMDDRGAIAAGLRADIVLIDDRGAMPRPVATIAGGRLAYADGRLAGAGFLAAA
ncbi:MAG: alpha-D-ribose 1-methylphosphonate 5-triphosphate diphosphatase [Alphaproteobacteria bacterium]